MWKNNVLATVEAEYGDFCVEGKLVTLAHHGARSHNPAPCNVNTHPLEEDGFILVSHLDLDTVGGVLALMGEKPKDKAFWEAAELIDVTGPHHMCELSQEIQDKLNAVYAWNDAKERVRYTEVTDVTEKISEWRDEIIKPLLRAIPDQTLIQNGQEWYKNTTEAVESKLVNESDNCRAFVTDGVFCAGSYFSPNLNVICDSIVTLNTKFRAITIAFEDGGKELSACEIAKSLWGAEAGGRDGIAGSPRGWELSDEELQREFERAIDTVNELIQERKDIEYDCR